MDDSNSDRGSAALLSKETVELLNYYSPKEPKLSPIIKEEQIKSCLLKGDVTDQYKNLSCSFKNKNSLMVKMEPEWQDFDIKQDFSADEGLENFSYKPIEVLIKTELCETTSDIKEESAIIYLNQCPVKPEEVHYKEEHLQQQNEFRDDSKGSSNFPTCSHSAGAFLCQQLTAEDIGRFYDKFNAKSTKIDQDNFILKHLTMHAVARRRPKNGKNRLKEARAKYFIRNLAEKMVPVCLNTFLTVLDVSRHRVIHLADMFYTTGEMAKERRGGDKISHKFAAKKEEIMTFLKKINGSGIHYCLNRTGRKYLPPKLNIRELWRIYSAETQDKTLQVKETYFRRIVNTHYHLRFDNPREDPS